MNLKRIHVKFLSILFLIWFSSACAPVYLPPTPHTPMLEEQGTAQASAQLGTSGVELKGAYALIDNTYLFGGLSASDEARADDAGSSRHRYAEFGAGRNWRPSGPLILEGAAGVGFGSGRGTASYQLGESRVRYAEGSYIKPFLQGNVALKTSWADFGFVNRLAVIQFGEITRTEGTAAVIDDSPGYLFWEPSLFIQLGPERLRFNTYVGLSSPVTGDPDFDYHFFNVGVGMQYRFNLH